MLYSYDGALKRCKCFIMNILNYFIAIIIILQMGNMYSYMENKILFFKTDDFQMLCNNWLKILAIIYVTFTLLLEKKIIDIRKVICLFVLFAYLMCFIKLNQYNYESMFDDFVIPFILFFLIFSSGNLRDRFDGFFKAFCNIAFIITIISLIFYFLGPVFNLVQGKEFFFRYGGLKKGESYYNLFFVNFSQNRPFLGIPVTRNIGIYAEAPGFAFMLSIELWWEIFGKEKINLLKCVLIIIAMLTTFSMKAYLMIALLAFLLFIKNTKKNIRLSNELISDIKVVILFILITVILFGISYVDIIKHMGSVSIRLEHSFAAIKTFFKYPLLGCGYNNREEILKELTSIDKGTLFFISISNLSFNPLKLVFPPDKIIL